MYHSQKYYKALELPKVLEMLAEETSCEDSRLMAVSLKPSHDFFAVQGLMHKTEDAYTLSVRYGDPTIYQLKNCSDCLKRAEKGSHLSVRELLDVANILRNIRAVQDWRRHCDVDKTALDDLFSFLQSNKPLETKIHDTILSEDEIADTASGELFDIRKKIKAAQLKARDHLDKIVKSTSYQKYLQESIVTIRDGRFVVPVKNEFRNEIKGLVHDTSASGATLFIEPMSVVEANNQIRVLKSREEQEIDRIILELSIEVGNYAQAIRESYDCLVEIDLTFAKSRLAYKMKAAVPILTNDGQIDLKKARHPLIPYEQVVPTDINLGTDFQTLVITGPNTGGKTVALKTLGLLTVMAMCGLMLPVGERSKTSVFQKVLVDIGDEQSIEQSLSTFSSHMTNIISVIEEADDKSLVLLDELGAGTDPVEGAALAISIIERLSAQKAKIAATTHYPEIKMYALTTKGVENASCEFDVVSLRPTYKLLIGIPGKSNAFAISERLGLPQSIIEAAKEHVSSDNSRFEDVVTMLEQTRQELEKEKEEMERLRLLAQSKAKEMEDYKEKLYKELDREREQSRQNAVKLVEQAKYQSQLILDELDELRRQKESEQFAKMVAEAKGSFKGKINSLEELADPVFIRRTEDYTLPRPLKKGDVVLVTELGEKGTVLSLPDSAGKVLVQVGIIKTKVDVETLRLETGKKKGSSSLSPTKGGAVSKSVEGKASRQASMEIDLRGSNVEEGLMEVDRFIDSCVMTGMSNITIIHGKGTGVLRTAIHQHLRKHKNVRTFRLGVYGEGESGVTVAELK